MKKLLGLLIVVGMVAAGCSKTATPTEPTNEPKYKIYFGQDAANHGFVAPTGVQAEKYTNAVYNQHKAIFDEKTQRKEFDYEFDCNDIFDLLSTFGVNVPQGVRNLQCEGVIHLKRKSSNFLDWDAVAAVAAAYGLEYNHSVGGGYGISAGGVGGLNIAGSIMRSMDTITVSMGFRVDYFFDSIAEVGSAQWGGRVAVAYGGVGFFDVVPTTHHVDMTVIDRFFATNPTFSYDWPKTLSFDLPSVGN